MGIRARTEKEFCGDIGDDQFPAIAKLPPVVALYRDKETYDDMVEMAIRVTNHNDKSVIYAKVYAAMLKAAIETHDKDAVIAAAKAQAEASGNADLNKEISDATEEALSMLDKPHREIGWHFGPSCHMPYGLPQTIHLTANR